MRRCGRGMDACEELMRIFTFILFFFHHELLLLLLLLHLSCDVKRMDC